ncbi:MAG: hypothetical protein U0892_00260 [Pirellulales bacterium]
MTVMIMMIVWTMVLFCANVSGVCLSVQNRQSRSRQWFRRDIADAEIGRFVLMKVRIAARRMSKGVEHQTPHDLIECGRSELNQCVRDHVKDRDAEHDATHEADQQLHASVGQSEPLR